MSSLEFLYLSRLILTFPERLKYMEAGKLIEFKTTFLQFRLKMLEMGQSLGEEDIIAERHLTVHLGNMFRIWAKQSETLYDTEYATGDDPPKAPEDGSAGPVPQE